jgi:gamma-glutamylcyclotransferase (GGCT)/AIG2-like uncharacterized protein YtfP
MHPNPDFLFTYGTLMQGFENPFARRLHALSTYEGKGSFLGLLYKISWYPGAVYNEKSESPVFGEVYRLSSKALILPELDDYEDVFEDEQKSLYLRKIIPVQMQDGSVLPCWVYLYNQDITGFEKIGTGDFRTCRQ